MLGFSIFRSVNADRKGNSIHLKLASQSFKRRLYNC